VSEEGVVVEVHFSIKAENLTIGSLDERVNLEQSGVLAHKQLEQLGDLISSLEEERLN
jgi:hypothetical protein